MSSWSSWRAGAAEDSAVEATQRCGITWPEQAPSQATCDSYRRLVLPVLLWWVLSPPYLAVMVWLLNGTPASGWKVTVQDADVPVPDRVQCVALKTPRPLLEKLTVPVGVVALPADVSLTVAVHFWNTSRDRWQVRAVVVARSVTVSTAWPLLAVWPPSPP